MVGFGVALRRRVERTFGIRESTGKRRNPPFAGRPHLNPFQVLTMQILVTPELMKPSLFAAALDRSITRPLMKGPRSLMRTTTRLAVALVGDLQLGAEGQSPVRGGHFGRVHLLAGGGLRIECVPGSAAALGGRRSGACKKGSSHRHRTRCGFGLRHFEVSPSENRDRRLRVEYGSKCGRPLAIP